MQLRIGLNVGDVMMRNGDVFGDGVNVAARRGGAGGARRHLHHAAWRATSCATAWTARFEDLGEHSVKNISRPIRAFRVIFDPHAEPRLPGNAQAAPAASEETGRGGRTLDRPGGDRLLGIRPGERRRRPSTGSTWSATRKAHSPSLRGRACRGRRQTDEPGVELAFWETVRDRGDAGMLRAYLEKYPQGEFRALAEIMLSDLEEASR